METEGEVHAEALEAEIADVTMGGGDEPIAETATSIQTADEQPKLSQEKIPEPGAKMPATYLSHLIPPQEPEEPTFGSSKESRFNIELEFVQCLANPNYLYHLATTNYFNDPAFIAYLSYLQYWRHPSYAKYIHYPAATFKNLELLQNERFRTEIGSPEVVAQMIKQGIEAAMKGPDGAGMNGVGGVGGASVGGLSEGGQSVSAGATPNPGTQS